MNVNKESSRPVPPDLEPEFLTLYQRCAGQTMTSVERMYALRQAIRYLHKASIKGAIVECGVWRGGSMMMAALSLLELGENSRELYLFDTYQGMPPPGPEDIRAETGEPAQLLLDTEPRDTSDIWAVAPYDVVSMNMRSTGYPSRRINMVEGRVEDTIPAKAPEQIALLRLDTDWYRSTAHELSHLYPRLMTGGVLIVDDYGYWRGSRQATDEYFCKRPLLLHRIDDTGRIAIKLP